MLGEKNLKNSRASRDTLLWDAFHNMHYHCDSERFRKLFARQELVKKISGLPGDIIDAGVFKGTSTILFAHLLDFYQPNSRSKVIAFDMFDEEFPNAKDTEISAVNQHQINYDPSAYDRLTEAIEMQRISHRIKIVKGDITKTLPEYLDGAPGTRISMLHCDLDIYYPTLVTLKACWPRMVKGGVVVFDEYAVEKWEESNAVDEFLATLDVAPRLRTIPNATSPTAYLIKETYGE
jgi:hypothetical protein